MGSGRDHVAQLQHYYATSRRSFNLFAGGAKHFGYHPAGSSISERQARLRMEDLLAERLVLSPGVRVLDAGCGQGVVSTRLCKEFACQIEGITLVPFEVGEAVALAGDLGVSQRVDYQIMDYSATTFPDRHFDAVYTMETLCHAQDIHRTLGEFRRLLRDGGTVVLFEYTVAPLNAFSEDERRRLEWMIREAAMPSLEAFEPTGFRRLMVEAGFRGVTSRDITLNFEPSLRHYRNIGLPTYYLIKALRLERSFPNVISIVEAYDLLKSGRVGYHVFQGFK